MRTRAHTLRHGLAALLILAALALLWQLRPGLPATPESWTAPMSTTEIEEITFWLLYLALAVLLLIAARALLDQIALTIEQTQEHRLRAFAERVLRKPAAPPTPRPSRYRVYADRYTMTLAPRSGIVQRSRHEVDSTALTVATQAAAAPATTEAPPPPPACSPPSLAICLLGPLRIDGAKQRIKRASTRELIVYLALHPAGARRDELLEALWPGQDPERVLPRFYQSVTDARKALGDAWVRDGERYQLDRSRVDIDLDQLERLLADDDPVHGQQNLEAAIGLWRGQPLAGSDYPWADPDIHGLHATLLDLLGRVSQVRFDHGDPRGALAAAEQAIGLDELHEPSWRLALQADHALGLRSSITRRYDALSHVLDEQLGLQPSHETRAVYRQLLGQS
ncbi:MAG: AfsR/SARP family transcriptional regulator [Solirubrobacteraceae bacterium]